MNERRNNMGAVVKSTVNIVPKETVYSTEDETLALFLEGKEYEARVISEDHVVAVGEDGQSRHVAGDLCGKPYWMDYQFRKKFKMVDPPITYIDTAIYEPVPGKPRYVEEVRKKTFGEVYEEVKQFLKERDIWDNFDYFTLVDSYRKETVEQPFPVWRWIACYAVVGGNEGHFVHIDIIDQTGKNIPFCHGKTFLGMDYALYAANMLTRVFWDEYKKCEQAPI